MYDGAVLFDCKNFSDDDVRDTALSQKSASYVQIKTRVVETKAPLDEILANACGVDTASAVYMECVRKRKPHPFPAHRLYIEPSERS